MEVRTILEEVFELTHVPVQDLEHEFGPDATGLSTLSKQNYENDRVKDQTGKRYEKIVVMVVLNTRLFRLSNMSVSPQIMSLLILRCCCVRLLVGMVGWIWWQVMRCIYRV
jgi:hypothetical protein